MASVWGVLSDSKNKSAAHDVAGDKFVIGREKAGAAHNNSLNLALKTATVSGKHCVLLRGGEDGEPALQDLSTNGTWVGGEKVAKKGTVALNDGVTISLGKPGTDVPEFVFQRGSSGASSADAGEGALGGGGRKRKSAKQQGGHVEAAERVEKVAKMEAENRDLRHKLKAANSKDGKANSSKAALLEGQVTSLEEQLTAARDEAEAVRGRLAEQEGRAGEQAASHAAALEKETTRSEALLEEERGRTKEAQAKLEEATEAHEAEGKRTAVVLSDWQDRVTALDREIEKQSNGQADTAAAKKQLEDRLTTLGKERDGLRDELAAERLECQKQRGEARRLAAHADSENAELERAKLDLSGAKDAWRLLTQRVTAAAELLNDIPTDLDSQGMGGRASQFSQRSQSQFDSASPASGFNGGGGGGGGGAGGGGTEGTGHHSQAVSPSPAQTLPFVLSAGGRDGQGGRSADSTPNSKRRRGQDSGDDGEDEEDDEEDDEDQAFDCTQAAPQGDVAGKEGGGDENEGLSRVNEEGEEGGEGGESGAGMVVEGDVEGDETDDGGVGERAEEVADEAEGCGAGGGGGNANGGSASRKAAQETETQEMPAVMRSSSILDMVDNSEFQPTATGKEDVSRDGMEDDDEEEEEEEEDEEEEDGEEGDNDRTRRGPAQVRRGDGGRSGAAVRVEANGGLGGKVGAML